jgi:hypothetical protein
VKLDRVVYVVRRAKKRKGVWYYIDQDRRWTNNAAEAQEFKYLAAARTCMDGLPTEMGPHVLVERKLRIVRQRKVD